jgi:undecaprenyl diphosphate synthase
VSNTNTLPNHIGIIMDGNRRWAKSRGLSATKGHEEGAQTLRQTALYAFSKGVKYLSVFAFSTENWQRAEEEVGFLMKLVTESFKRHLQEFADDGIKIIILGERHDIDEKLKKEFELAEDLTKDNTEGTLAICFNYGGRQEIIHATQQLIKSGLEADKINENAFAKYLYRPEVPDIDIMVRTSGEMRISNFMLWRIAYSELMFIDKHWPDFNESDLDAVIAEYSKRQRRFGG